MFPPPAASGHTEHQDSATQARLHPAAPDPAPLPPSGPARLLLVESDAANGGLLTGALSAYYHVEAVGDALAAWHAAQRLPPDLVLIGLSIRGLDSLVLIQSLRAALETALLPIIVLTSSVDRDLMLRCLAAGASNFLLKPFGLDELLACVRLELGLHGSLTRPASPVPA